MLWSPFTKENACIFRSEANLTFKKFSVLLTQTICYHLRTVLDSRLWSRFKKSLAANRAKRKKDHCDLSGCSDDVTDKRVTTPRMTGSPLGVRKKKAMHIRTPFKHRHARGLTFKIWPIWIKRQISGWKINTVHFISTTCPSVSAESHLCSIKDIALLLGLFIQPTQRPLKAKNLSHGFQAATEEDAIPMNTVA